MNRNLSKVSVILCTYNGGERIKETLDYLLIQNYPKDKIEIIVVDDGSIDNTSNIIGKYPVKLIKHDENKGLAAARNTGVSNASGEIICFTDDDCIADKNWIKELVGTYIKNPRADGVGGRIEAYQAENMFEKYAQYSKNPIYQHIPRMDPSNRLKNYIKKIFGISRPKLKDNQKLSSIMGANSSYKKEVFERVGGCDPSFRRGVDWELNMRLNKICACLVYCDKAIVYHKHRVSLKSFFKHIYEYGEAYGHVYRKHPEIKLLLYPIPVIFIIGLILSLFYPISIFLLVVLYYLKDLPYLTKLLIRNKDITILLFPFIELGREFTYNIGMFREIRKTR